MKKNNLRDFCPRCNKSWLIHDCPIKNNRAEIAGDKSNIGQTKNDQETFKIVFGLLKTLKKKDEMGFCIKKTHYVIRKGNFSK